MSYSYPSVVVLKLLILFEVLFLLQHCLFPLLIKTRSERPAYRPHFRDTHDVFLLLNQFSSQLETEAEFIPTVPTKLINREADAGELGPGWMWVLTMEIMSR